MIFAAIRFLKQGEALALAAARFARMSSIHHLGDWRMASKGGSVTLIASMLRYI
jgi:hypothetical protein